MLTVLKVGKKDPSEYISVEGKKSDPFLAVVTQQWTVTVPSIRQGAEVVSCAYRRDEENMPGSRREVQNAKEEGVNFVFNRQPIEIVGEKWQSHGRESGYDSDLASLIAVVVAVQNQFRIQKKFYRADAVLLAFGFRTSPADWFTNVNINLDGSGRVVAAEQQTYKFQTSNPKIFAGGDMVRGSDLVVTAIWEGRQAAEGILDYLDI